MKTKWICTLILLLAFTLSLTACGRPDPGDGPETQAAPNALGTDKDNAPNPADDESDDAPDAANPQDTDAVKNAPKVGTVNDSAFSGKVKGCYYADGNRIIVQADKLYLYDTQKGESLASADISLEDTCVQTCQGGYFIVGRENGGGSGGSLMTSQGGGGINGYLLNQDFQLENQISLDELAGNDFIMQTTAAAISPDGTKIALAGLEGFYLYDIVSQSVSTILNYSENGSTGSTQILAVGSLTFTGDNTLAYVGQGADSQSGGDGFTVYGTVSTDTGALTLTKKADYQVDETEVQKGGDLLVMPQTFDKNNGTLLTLDTASNKEKMLSFAGGSEGKDGIYCSDQGKYVAVSVLGESSVTISLYDTASGQVIHTETVENSDNTYFGRIPQILILEESGTCIVVLGSGIDEVSTLITTFGFVG